MITNHILHQCQCTEEDQVNRLSQLLLAHMALQKPQ